jgi:hypothetical protein
MYGWKQKQQSQILWKQSKISDNYLIFHIFISKIIIIKKTTLIAG